ncbi:D-2-hydroxyacid dehydrogenase [Streptomyces sp. KM273126]|uniref:D-2-hydroxyacid dehydrogenase n=1 Tax=Streptomyces sp. KM273126 TaxID=2545247 RepID=UPI0026B70087|nr:D-2-hydroxyacid dehydrogenase [Streptomyces sp. KM273126]
MTLLIDPVLLPPMRHRADFSGDPGYLRTAEQQARFHALLDSADALLGIPGSDPADLARAVRSNPRLRWVHATSAGGGQQVGAANLAPQDLQRVTFTTSAGVHGSSLSEFALLGILSGAKDLPRLLRLQAQHHWSDRWMSRPISRHKVLVLGFGGIGREVSRCLSLLGASVTVMSRNADAEHPDVDRFVTPDALSDVIGEMDAIVCALPGTDLTRHMVDDQFLAKVRPGVTFVNVGRGTVVDESALITALQDGRIGYAALDVFEVEPLPHSSPLWSMPNVLISPHTAALSADQEEGVADLFADNATRLLDGHPLKNVVNTIEFY